MAPDGVYLPKRLPMVRSSHVHLKFMMDTLMSKYHPAAQILGDFGQALMYQ